MIGAGAAGIAIATAAATRGASVVLIEGGRLGGQWLNAGSVPSHALIAAARRAEAVRSSAAFGIKVSRVGVEFHAVNDHIQRVIAAIGLNDSKERLEGLGVRVVLGKARFGDPRTVLVGDEFEIRARRFVIATGSAAAIPDIPGLDRTPYLTTDTVFESRALPKQLIVIGAGRTGLELAQAFRRLGSTVTVLDAGRPLADEESEAARIVLQSLAREGVVVRAGVRILRTRRNRSKIEVVVAGDGDGEEEALDGTDLLIATGRRPNIDELGLEAGRIRASGDGIAVNRRKRTSNRRVYAAGEVTGFAGFTHVATRQAENVVRRLLLHLPTHDLPAVPRVTFTDPELAHVGLSEEQARLRRRRIRLLRWPYQENARAQAEYSTTGHIKVVTSRKGTILGATIVGASAGELISLWTLAVSQRMNIRDLAELAVPHPTLAEIGRQAVIGDFDPRLTVSRTRRMLAWLRGRFR